MYSEEALLPVSALQHLVFCPRQCALIHLEGVWDENLYTAQGRVMHRRVHEERRESRGDVRLEYGLQIRSFELGLVGRADLVEFHRPPGPKSRPWKPRPVEYKRGRPKKIACDLVQLCAQAMCLEEMLGVEIPEGDLYYGKKRRRHTVVLDLKLREETRNAAHRLHELIKSGLTPASEYSERCEACSIKDHCLPRTCSRSLKVDNYLAKAVKES